MLPAGPLRFFISVFQNDKNIVTNSEVGQCWVRLLLVLFSTLIHRFMGINNIFEGFNSSSVKMKAANKWNLQSLNLIPHSQLDSFARHPYRDLTRVWGLFQLVGDLVLEFVECPRIPADDRGHPPAPRARRRRRAGRCFQSVPLPHGVRLAFDFSGGADPMRHAAGAGRFGRLGTQNLQERRKVTILFKGVQLITWHMNQTEEFSSRF